MPPDDRTVPRLLLRPIDAAWPVSGYVFEADCAPPGQPEYILLRSRYDAAVRKVWAVGERVRVSCGRLLLCDAALPIQPALC